MSPLKLIKIYSRAQRVLGLFEEARMSKSLFASKVFWFNVLTAGASLLDVLPVPKEYAVIAVGVINIALRFVTTQPVHVR